MPNEWVIVIIENNCFVGERPLGYKHHRNKFTRIFFGLSDYKPKMWYDEFGLVEQ